jgi:hypothetical protein
MRLFVPYSFDGLRIDGNAGIYSAAFSLPTPKVASKITQVSGGELLDLDFGYDADVVPAPFTVRFYFESTTPGGLYTLFNSLCATPDLGGKVGTTGYFICTIHGGSTQYRCTAQMQEPVGNLTGRNYGPSIDRWDGVNVKFVPTTVWTAV